MTTPTPTLQKCNVVPGKTTTVLMTPQWLPEHTEYPACAAAYAPLINGEQTFSALAKAIRQAEKSIDIITWGFQPSMYFERPGKRVGDLLEEAAGRGVIVRVLVWFSDTGQLVDPNFPGWDAYLPEEQQRQTHIFETADERRRRLMRRIDKQGATLLATGHRLSYETDEQYAFDKYWHFRAANNDIKNLTVRHRELSWVADSASVASRLAQLPYPVKDDSSVVRGVALSLGATHHQKMVLVDYADPDWAVGFVMGHNMLSQYWDTDKHSAYKQACDKGRDGPTGWQDISACVYGEVLRHMNDNFAQAWEKDTGDSTPKQERAAITKEAFTPTPARLTALNSRLSLPIALKAVMGQICRTQPQYHAWDILKAYMESVKRVRQYIYIENQYFRFQPLAEQLSKTINSLREAGYTQEIYLFVVTNSTEKPADNSWPSVATGGYQTYKMLDALGRADLMQPYAKKAKGTTEEVKPQYICGLKTLICTLVSPDSTADNWIPVYVHSKMMMVDDTFMIQGSANINLRSMAYDSEIAIALQDTDISSIIPEMRNRLWGMHTNKHPSISIVEEFRQWLKIIDANEAQKDDSLAPTSSLIKFNDNNIKLSNMD